jgi:hypothetical protein
MRQTSRIDRLRERLFLKPTNKIGGERPQSWPKILPRVEGTQVGEWEPCLFMRWKRLVRLSAFRTFELSYLQGKFPPAPPRE